MSIRLLRPCPFCLSQNVRLAQGYTLQVLCENCGAEGPIVRNTPHVKGYNFGPDNALAADLWNAAPRQSSVSGSEVKP